MAELPNNAKAIVDIKKLEDYCLNPQHQRGKHKAKVFKSVLGFTKKEAKILSDKLLDAAKNNDAYEIASDIFGTRYYIDCQIIYKNKTAAIRSIWIIRTEENIPRLITCYIK
jgi:hypothetical protein